MQTVFEGLMAKSTLLPMYAYGNDVAHIMFLSIDNAFGFRFPAGIAVIIFPQWPLLSCSFRL